jgi:uncharacterized protein (TIGR00255 family)
MSDIRSMTGMGLAQKSTGEFDISVKVQTVNSRYFDINMRMPSAYNIFEIDLRNTAREYVSRGKVDVYFDIRDLREDSVEPVLNKGVVNAVISAVNELPTLETVDKNISAASLISFHHALKLEPRDLEDPEAFKADMRKVLVQALEQLVTNRTEEGRRLVDDISQRIERCGKLLEAINESAETIKKEYKDRLHERIKEILESDDIDEGRLEQEVAYLVDRADVTEEIVRFRSHMQRFGEIIGDGGEVGKKLDFLMQEMNREINTIGSKAKSLDINRVVVDIKSELEKVREEVQNIE